MINIVLTLLTFLFLVYNKIFLLNEESLILLCFFVFLHLSLNHFGKFVYEFFNNQSKKIQLNLSSLLNQVYLAFLTFSLFQSTLQFSLNHFKKWFVRLYKLKSFFISCLLNFNCRKITLIFIKRLDYLKRIEHLTVKLLTFLIINKIKKSIEVKQFYGTNVKNYYFLSLNKVTLREYIQLVSIKK